jgi:hypothetical protein
MWENKDNALDATYNADHIWFDGIGGQHTQKPANIRKWEDSKVYKLIEKQFPKVKADKMLADLSIIALEWAKSYVRQRQTFKMNTKGENMAPLAFQSDPEGIYIPRPRSAASQHRTRSPRRTRSRHGHRRIPGKDRGLSGTHEHGQNGPWLRNAFTPACDSCTPTRIEVQKATRNSHLLEWRPSTHCRLHLSSRPRAVQLLLLIKIIGIKIIFP